MMQYKGYFGKAEYDDEARIFHGKVIGIKDTVTFEGTSVNELEQAFKDSVNDFTLPGAKNWAKNQIEHIRANYMYEYQLTCMLIWLLRLKNLV